MLKNNKKTLYIHIWCPKTWTTTLQTHIFPKLINTKIYTNSCQGKIYNKIINPLHNYITLKKYKKELNNPIIFNNLRKEIINSNVNNFIISSEALVINDSLIYKERSNMKERALKINKLYLFISDICNIKIIITIRNQYELIKSYYAETNWYWYSFKNFVDFFIKEKIWDYNYILNYYENIFKKENIYVWPMEKIFNESINWVNEISKYLPVENKKIIINNLTNKKSNKRKLKKSLYIINNYRKSYIISIPTWIYQKILKKKNYKSWYQPIYVQKITKILKKIESFFYKNKKKENLEYSSKQKRKINESFTLSNKKIEKKYLLNLKEYNYY